MKTTTMILALALLLPANITAGPDPETDPKPAAIAAPMLGTLIIGMAIIGVYCVITINSTLPSDKSPVALSLQKSNDHSNWETVCTKTVTLNGTDPIEFFRDEMVDNVAFYRVKKAQ
jgi:hypothetical protein